YWYARVIGIFHAMASSSHTNVSNHSFQRMEILWVCWYGAEPNYRHGFRLGQMPKVGFVAHTDEDAFGFLDPKCVIRGCHMIPAFAEGRTSELLPLPRSAARVLDEKEVDDWTNFYVGIFADRDMMLWHFGRAIGHIDDPCHSKTNPQSDFDPAADLDEMDKPSDEESHGAATDSEPEQDTENGSEVDGESDGYASP
ncbi:hypothetical protein M378DRAFT_91987, partial [Amanita muscaria Koide BX008]